VTKQTTQPATRHDADAVDADRAHIGVAHRGKPPKRTRRLAIAVAAMLGALGGLGFFTFGYGEGHAYLSNDPNACINCHVMQDHFDAWINSSHSHVATCNDCHLSHHPVGKWVTKADNGFFHSLAFTTGEFHEPIRIKERNARVTQAACLHCHDDVVHGMLPAQTPTGGARDWPGADVQRCTHCHADVGHAGRR
jgi:cytochrome c nitrite reductase small subunit